VVPSKLSTICFYLTIKEILNLPGRHFFPRGVISLHIFLDSLSIVVVSTWESVEDWKPWEESQRRMEIQKKIDSHLGGKVTPGNYYYR
jgi:hypothetical protein